MVTNQVDSSTRDAALVARLVHRSEVEPDFWDFQQLRERSGSHGIFQYPAMMVPELQGALLDDLIAVDPTVGTVYDPFVGSGTVLVESITRGLDFVGGDVNPMAVLLSSVKADPPTLEAAREGYLEVLTLAPELDAGSPRQFFGRDKWFTKPLIAELQQLKTAIQTIPAKSVRRFLWVCLAEAIRLTSNSRISTFKLHMYPPEVLRERQVSAIASFEAVAERNVRGLDDFWTGVVASHIRVGRSTLLPGPASSTWSHSAPMPDVLMTSPPYGDNKTTVPYGQHSYLPLQWIDERDIEGGIDSDLLASTAAIDSASLGGSNRGVLDRQDELSNLSPHLAEFLKHVDDRDALVKKVLAFTGDYYDTLQSVSSRLRPDAYSFLTLGERRVGGQLFPLVAITADLLHAIGHIRVHDVQRNLPRRKRIAVSNSEGATMASETVLVTRREARNE